MVETEEEPKRRIKVTGETGSFKTLRSFVCYFEHSFDRHIQFVLLNIWTTTNNTFVIKINITMSGDY